MVEVLPSDPENTRIIEEKRNYTISANGDDTPFYEDNEQGWVSEILVKCNSPSLILEVSLGTDIDSMKISDAQDYGLNAPNTSFWIPSYAGGGSGDIYVIAYQPFNPQSYKGSVKITLKNDSASDITINKVIFKRIVKKTVTEVNQITPSPGQEYPLYAIQLPEIEEEIE